MAWLTKHRIFVGVPNIAQDKVDDAELDIQGVHVLDSASDSFRMEINSTITTDGSIHAKIDPFEGALYLTDLGKESTFVTLDFPETSAEKHQKVNVSQHENIEDMTTFTQFNSFFIYNKTVSVTVEGKTKAQPRGLNRKYGVNFKKTLEFAGLNKLAGTAVPVQSANLSFTKDEDGNNFRGVAIIPNPSVFTLDIVSAFPFGIPLGLISTPCLRLSRTAKCARMLTRRPSRATPPSRSTSTTKMSAASASTISSSAPETTRSPSPPASTRLASSTSSAATSTAGTR